MGKLIKGHYQGCKVSWWGAESLLMGALPWVSYALMKPGHAVFRQCINSMLRGFLEARGEEEASRCRKALKRAMLRDAALTEGHEESELPCDFEHDQKPGHHNPRPSLTLIYPWMHLPT